MRALAAMAFSAILGCSALQNAPEILLPETPQLLPSNNAQSYVLEAVDSHSVVLLGEVHLGVSSERIFMSSLMPFLHQHGIERIALEIASAYQQQVDGYLASGNVGDAWFFKNTSYFSVIESAKANNLGILCMNDIRYRNADNRYLADYTMFENVKKIVDNNEKTIVFSGASHVAETGNTLGGLLDDAFGEESFSIILPVEGAKSYLMLSEYYDDYRAIDLDNSAVGGILANSEFTLSERYDAAVFLPRL